MWFISKAGMKKMIEENSKKFAEEAEKENAILSAEIKRINELEALKAEDDLTKKAIDEKWHEYWAHYESLAQPLRKRIAYVLARRRWSTGTSGFHGQFFQSDLPFPIKMCGWFYYHNSSHNYKDGGVMFRLDPECFGRWDTRLFYFDDDGWPFNKKWTANENSSVNETEKELELIRSYSSGISDVHIELLTCTDQFGNTEERRCVVFRLDSSATKKSIPGADPTLDEPIGEYVFCLPRAGEFWCTLGEISDGKAIALHHDNFCMK